MADYVWTGALGGDGDLDQPGNYTVDGSTATVVPTAADTLTTLLAATEVVSIGKGTCYAGTVTLLSWQGVWNGTFMGSVTMGSNHICHGGTFMGTVTNSGTINAGNFNGTLTNQASGIVYDGVYGDVVNNTGDSTTIYGGTFNGTVTNQSSASIYDGTFNASVSNITNATIFGGHFWQDVSSYGALIGGGRYEHRLSYNGGTRWYYAPDSPAVAPASKVLTGNSNLGTAGTLVLPPAGTQSMGIGM